MDLLLAGVVFDDPGLTIALSVPFVGPPLLIAALWIGAMIWRRRYSMAEWFLFIGYMALVIVWVTYFFTH
jgi:hypothetical protein